MILNNYKTMLAIESNYKDKKLNKEMLFELHEGRTVHYYATGKINELFK